MADTKDNDDNGKAEVLQKCQPTVFIGLGGTGMEIMLRLRRRILQHSWNGVRLSSLSEFPLAGFLYFDTDTNDARETGRAAATDPMGAAVRFAQGDTLQKKVDVIHYQNEGRNYPQIDEWLPSADFSKIDTEKGAGQVRAISRLLFFDVYPEFMRLVQAKASRVLANVNNDSAMKKLNIDTSPHLRIVVLASTAGGTGSGSFIDVGYAVSQMQSPKAEQVDLFLLLPGGFTGANRERVFANTYAAAMELEYVMREQRDAPYVQGWTQFDKSDPSRKPFKEVYLLDTTNLSQERTERATDLYDMIADILFEDFGSSDFASRKRSVAVNQQNHKLAPFHPPLSSEFGQNSMAFSRVYSAVGQCTLATKGRVLLDTAIAEAGLRMVETFFGIAQNGPKNLPNAENRDEFLRKHLKLSVTGFDEYPKDLPNRPPSISEFELVSHLLMRQNKSSTQDALVDQLQSEFQGLAERFTDFKDWPREADAIRDRRKIDVDGRAGTGEVYGPLGREVAEARSRLSAAWRAEEGEGSLKALLYGLLDDHERGGLDYTISLIEQVKDRIDDPANGAIVVLHAAAEQYGKLADFFLNRRYNPSLERLRETAQSRGLGGRKTAAIIVEQLRDDLRMHLILRMRSIACTEAAGLLRDISSFLGDRMGLDEQGKTRWSGLISEFTAGYDTVAATLDFVRQDVARLHDARDRPEGGMYLLVDDRSAGDITVPTEDMLEWAKEAFESYRGSKKLFAVLRTPEGKVEIINQLQAIAKRRLAHVETRIPTVGQALRGLAPNDRRALLSKALTRAMPWLEANFDRFRGELKGDQFKLFVAVKEALQFESEFGHELRDLIPPGFGIQEAGFVESGIAGRLLVYCELSGIPLDVITPLRADWRRSYDQILSSPSAIPLHNHKDWLRFPIPVVPTTGELERLRSDLNLFLRAVAFGLLRRDGRAVANAQYLMQMRQNDWESVGSERTIRKKLFDPAHRRSLEDQALRFEESLTTMQIIAAASLFQYTAEKAYAPRLEKFDGDRNMRVGGLIHKVARDLETEFLDRFAATASKELAGSAEAFKNELFAKIDEWTNPIRDSLKDADPNESNLNPADTAEFRAREKRTIRPDRFKEEALREIAGGTVSHAVGIDGPGASGKLRFYVRINKETRGPLAEMELVAMAERGELKPADKICPLGGQTWVAASSLEVLAPLMAPPPPPPDD